MNHNPSQNEIEFVNKALEAFNNKAVGPDNHKLINIVEYDEQNNIIAGINGGTYWGWLYIDILWVNENFRKKGIGSKLLKATESEAKKRGCHHAHLETMSWQAPEFYKKHDYNVAAILNDIPKGHKKFLMLKEL